MISSDHHSKRRLPHESEHERAVRQRLAHLLATTPIRPEELVDNLALYLRRQPLTDLLSLDSLYRMILDVPGAIMEFGVHWGRHVAALTTLRSLYEPYNPHRRIIGFDTFTGFPQLAGIDETTSGAVTGKFALPYDSRTTFETSSKPTSKATTSATSSGPSSSKATCGTPFPAT